MTYGFPFFPGQTTRFCEKTAINRPKITVQEQIFTSSNVTFRTNQIWAHQEGRSPSGSICSRAGTEKKGFFLEVPVWPTITE
jgi:hypothetical protein